MNLLSYVGFLTCDVIRGSNPRSSTTFQRTYSVFGKHVILAWPSNECAGETFIG